MRSSVMRVEERELPLCTGNHEVKFIYFCKSCANNKLPLEKIFFCAKCNNVLGQHTHMGDRYSVTTENFLIPYKEFKGHIQMTNNLRLCSFIQKVNEPKVLNPIQIKQTMKVYLANNPPIYNPALQNGPVSLAEFQSFPYRKWLVENTFWTKPFSANINNHIDAYADGLGMRKPKVNQWANFIIDLDTSPAAAINLTEEIQSSKKSLVEIQKAKLLGDLFLSITTCFKEQEIKKCMEQCNKIKGEFEPNFFLIYLGKLKILELHSNGTEFEKVLKEIDLSKLSKRQKELYYYYSAISEWVQVAQPLDQNKDIPIFYEARNKSYYKMKKPKQYVKNLSLAIDIQKRSIYLASRAIGYIILGENQKAEQDFAEAAINQYRNDAMLNNRHFNRSKLHQELQKATLQEQLHQKKTQYIINVCKYLKKNKRYEELQQCCKELIQREPNNIKFRVYMIKALIRLGREFPAIEELAKIKELKKLPEEEVVELERSIELLKANEQDSLNNYEGAEGKFQNIARMGKPSATHWHNYSAFLFKYRDIQEKNDKALKAINQALQIKQKQQFFELKYLILFQMGNFQQAQLLHDYVKDEKFGEMVKYVDNYIGT